mmetsp:Transcript_8650/g.17413  ORF Transcript_8650/g.17413 Transcript_8650/m.17413 type:complete len:247 (+) Transcript_8650:530-1270(+)
MKAAALPDNSISAFGYPKSTELPTNPPEFAILLWTAALLITLIESTLTSCTLSGRFLRSEVNDEEADTRNSFIFELLSFAADAKSSLIVVTDSDNFVEIDPTNLFETVDALSLMAENASFKDVPESSANLERDFVTSREVMALFSMDPPGELDVWEERVTTEPSNESWKDPFIDSATIDPSVDDKASATALAESLADSVAGNVSAVAKFCIVARLWDSTDFVISLTLSRVFPNGPNLGVGGGVSWV